MGTSKFEEARFIYYVSYDNIDQLYRTYFGPREEEIVKIKDEMKGIEKEASVGIGQLMKIAGLEASASGSVTETEGQSINITRKITEMDLAVQMAELLFNDFELPDISNMREEGRMHTFYKFTLPLETRSKTGEDVSKIPEFIEVFHNSEKYNIEGVTSGRNWNSSSFVRNLLDRTRVQEIEISGILHPMSVNKDGGILNVRAQYLLLCSASTGD